MTSRGRLWIGLVLVTALLWGGCKGKSVTTASRSLPTVLGQETLDLPPAQQAERQTDVLGYLLRTPSDYASEAEIEIDVDNVEDELAKLRAELGDAKRP